MDELIERLREHAEFEDKRVLDEAKAMGFVPEVYSGSQAGALLREAAAALEAAREDAERWRHARRILTVEDIENSQDMFDAFGLEGNEHENRKADAAIDRARGKEVQGEA